LEVGRLADLVMLDRDYMAIQQEEIINIQSLFTMVGGRVVFDAGLSAVSMLNRYDLYQRGCGSLIDLCI